MAFLSANPSHFDVKAILFHKNERGKSSHKSINVESFRELLNSDEYQAKLRDGKLAGLLTHAGRKTARENTNIPHADNVIIDDNLCNILRAVDEDDECVYGYFDLYDADNPKSAAYKLKKLWKMGTKIGVSISTELVESANEFFIKKFHGVDFTLYPEFTSPIIQVNFSAQEDGSTKIINEEPNLMIGNFSLKEYMREQSLSPYAILRGRIDEVVRFLRFHGNNKVNNERWLLKSYIGSYIRSYVNKAMSSGDINLMMTLRLDSYCTDRRALRELQISLNRAKSQLRQNGYMTSDVQRSVDKSYTAVMSSIYDYINKKSKVEESDKAL